MNIDMAALHAIVVERGISFDDLLEDVKAAVLSEWEDTPEGFGRIAATTARQVMLQRLRDAENERTFGEFSTHEGEIVAGVIQRDSRANARGLVVVRMGTETKASEGVIP